MATTDVVFDEAKGNPASRECHYNFSRGDSFFVATEKVLSWSAPADGDATRAIVPAVEVEMALREAPVPDPSRLNTTRSLAVCLDTPFVGDALSEMKDQDLLRDFDADDDSAVVVFDTFQDYIARCDDVLKAMQDNPRVQVDETSFDQFEAWAAGGAGRWLFEYTLEQLTKETKNLRLHVELSCIVGPHALAGAANRDDANSQLARVGGTAAAAPRYLGTLGEAMLLHFHGEAATGAPASDVSHQLDRFLIDTMYDELWAVDTNDLSHYAIDVKRRGRLETASRKEGAEIARSRIVAVLPRLAPLDLALGDFARQPGSLVRELQAIGDAVLGGQRKEDSPFSQMRRVRDFVREEFSDVIADERHGGKASTDVSVMLVRKIEKLRKGEEQDEKQRREDEPDLEAIAPPKPSQVEKATRAASYLELERAYLPRLRAGNTTRR